MVHHVRQCAPVEGRYPLGFEAGTLPADCTSLGVGLPQGPLDIQQPGSGARRRRWTAWPMEGTLYQGNDFSLLGTQAALDGGTTQFSMSGRYTQSVLDGGTGSLLWLVHGHLRPRLDPGDSPLLDLPLLHGHPARAAVSERGRDLLLLGGGFLGGAFCFFIRFLHA